MTTFETVSTMTAPGFRCALNWTKVAFSDDARYCAAPGHDGNVYIWDVSKGTLHSTLSNGHDDGVASCVAWSPSDSVMVSGDRSGRIAVWS